MDKEIPQPIQKIRDESKSFEEVLLLAAKFIPLNGKFIRVARIIDRQCKARKVFTLQAWSQLHDIGLALWYKQYSNSSRLFNFEDFSRRLQPGYLETFNFWFGENAQLIKLPDGEELGCESLKIWQEFIARMAYISYVEQQTGKKRKKRGLEPDSLIAIMTAVALVLGIGLAIAVNSSQKPPILKKYLTPHPPSLQRKGEKERNSPLPQNNLFRFSPLLREGS